VPAPTPSQKKNSENAKKNDVGKCFFLTKKFNKNKNGMQRFLQNVRSELQKDKVVAASGFAIGFFPVLFRPETLQFPLSSIFNASFAGFFCSIGAGFADIFLPTAFRPIFPILALSTCTFYAVRCVRPSPPVANPSVNPPRYQDV
jgi:hypothetical protein